eukprot:UC1_evm1s1923
MAEDTVVVAVRVRPMNTREERATASLVRPRVIRMNGQQTELLGDSASSLASAKTQLERKTTAREDRTFSFDYSLWSADPSDEHFQDQAAVYSKLGVGLLDNAFAGYNACIFAYGQTGSGKTYTMMGTETDPGLIPRICTELFNRAADASKSEPDVTFKVECSYLEIYNEKVRDLLGPGPSRQGLKVREHKIMGPYVEGLRTIAVEDYAGIEDLMRSGNRLRATASTMMNVESSRSHAVFNVHVTQTKFDKMSNLSTEKTSRISLVDLAGSERVSRSGAEGDRLKEGGSINKSLSTLGLVISNLADQASGKKGADTFIPYRDSVLTWLLKENLGGNSRSVMVATVSPSADNYGETLSTLRYADTAKRIKTHAVVNEDANAKLIRELREEVERLRSMVDGVGVPGGVRMNDEELMQLRERLAESERLMQSLTMSWEEKLRIAQTLMEERQQQLQDMGISVEKGGLAMDESKRYLLNLNPARGTGELSVYCLSEDITRIGSARDQDICIIGEGILNEHCCLHVQDSALFVMPLQEASVFLNDQPVDSSTVLLDGSTLRLGASREFRVSCPNGRIDAVLDPSAAAAAAASAEEDAGVPGSASWPGSRFHRACELGDLAKVKLMLSAGAHPNSEEARWKRAPIMLAADHGFTSVCQLLILAGAEAGRADERGYTAVHAAADSGHFDICKMLLDAGAEADPSSLVGCTPLHRSAEQGHLDICKMLVEAGAQVNAQDHRKGWTPLLLAALHGRAEVCAFLVKSGAEVNCVNRYRETPLHMAAHPGHARIVKLLVKAGADASLEQVYGRTAFDYASEHTSFSMLHSPLDHLNQRDAICRILHARMRPEQQQSRSLSERKVVTISQVFAQEKFQMQVFDSTKPQQGTDAKHVPRFQKGGGAGGASSSTGR